MKILYSSSELHNAIKRVLADPQPEDRRIVLVAFVGGRAEAFLRDPKDLEIVCCLQPGSTDALTLDRLRSRHAKIFKSERLHMKVYWSSRNGCVICSANASAHGLGRDGLKEAGVYLPPNTVDINLLWGYAKPKLIKDADLQRLTRETQRMPRQKINWSQEPAADFLEWLNFAGRSDWKLGWWEEEDEFSKSAIKIAKERYAVNPYDLLNVKQRQITQYDWALAFKVPGVTDLKWFYTDFVTEVDASDGVYPLQAVQANPPAQCPRPPFKLDNAFKRAFRKAVFEYGEERIIKIESLRAPKALLNSIAEKMRTNTQDRAAYAVTGAANSPIPAPASEASRMGTTRDNRLKGRQGPPP
jgi:hypothetical protein